MSYKYIFYTSFIILNIVLISCLMEKRLYLKIFDIEEGNHQEVVEG